MTHATSHATIEKLLVMFSIHRIPQSIVTEMEVILRVLNIPNA